MTDSNVGFLLISKLIDISKMLMKGTTQTLEELKEGFYELTPHFRTDAFFQITIPEVHKIVCAELEITSITNKNK